MQNRPVAHECERSHPKIPEHPPHRYSVGIESDFSGLEAPSKLSDRSPPDSSFHQNKLKDGTKKKKKNLLSAIKTHAVL